MALTHHFVSTPPPSDLRSKPFQEALQRELTPSFLEKATATIGALVSLALVLIAALAIVGSSGFLGTAIATAGGAAGAFVLFILWRKRRLRHAYKTLLAHPENFRLHRATITRISPWALPSPGSDLHATRVFWGGPHPGSATFETELSPSRAVQGKEIMLAIAKLDRHAPPLLVSLNPPT